MTTDQTITCPNCSRQVEAGFKFCDFCGAKLESVSAPAPAAPTEAGTTKPGFRDRLKARREERDELEQARRTVEASPTTNPTLPADTKEIPAPPRITSKPMKAAELREQGPAIAGRVRWREGDQAEPPSPEDTTEQPRVPAPPPPAWTKVDETPSGRPSVGGFIVHLLIAFVSGALLVALAAIVASLTSNGSVALLEVRGLPIFIAGAMAIIVFSLLRTGPRAKGDRRSIAISVTIGFLILVAAVALLYRPSLMTEAQQQLDATLGIFGPEVEEAVQRFTGDIDQWNTEVNNYRTDLVAVDRSLDTEQDPAKREAATKAFQIAASGQEAALEGIHKRMESHAEAIDQRPLRDALRDLAAVFGDELAGIRLLTRGYVANDQPMVQSGDTRFKDATARAVELFEERVEPILDRADIDASALEASVTELRG